jgi:hypothetical protein
MEKSPAPILRAKEILGESLIRRLITGLERHIDSAIVSELRIAGVGYMNNQKHRPDDQAACAATHNAPPTLLCSCYDHEYRYSSLRRAQAQGAQEYLLAYESPVEQARRRVVAERSREA